MKKFISGVIVGVLLLTSVSAFADSASLIGQKVQGLFSVEKNGVKITDAVIIKGTAYAPVRSISEAAGVTLNVEGKKILMGETSTTSAAEAVSVELSRLNSELKSCQANIDSTVENVIKPREANLAALKAADNGSAESAFTISSVEKRLESERAYVAEQQALIDKAKARIAELTK
ncbi:hypothetical protein [Paenibacillus sp. FSL L8-0708]|uniref:hypothetical protein n=1 Tax=Paenibacillus sp. FSL L8-0708 TaxID=2975311 RepID=UPI0030F94436